MDISDYQEWGKQVAEVTAKNNILFEKFEQTLKSQGLSTDKVDQELTNISVFGNTFLTQEEVIPIQNGMLEIGAYLGSYFISEIPWANPDTIEETALSILQFYKFLASENSISKNELAALNTIVDDNLDLWITEFHLYNSSCEF